MGIAAATLLFFMLSRYACVLRARLTRGRGLWEADERDRPRESLTEWEEIDLENNPGAAVKKVKVREKEDAAAA